MALSDKDRKRAEELARELMKITGGRIKPDGVSKTFAEIEEEAIEVTDIVASALIKQTAKDAPDAPTQCRCPECKAVPGDRGEDDEPIVLLTDRGEVDFLTKGYFCRRCRRSFFSLNSLNWDSVSKPPSVHAWNKKWSTPEPVRPALSKHVRTFFIWPTSTSKPSVSVAPPRVTAKLGSH
ncbi:hypothetical protein [Rhodopirellula europaea]|uniref:hypothetical protein n=1 Tax=Rhodopirellula europaea TaxID=1263866 RepID=UPI003D2B33F9